jgi:alkanesulfonate monooxygenase SsuD/methylene tetrahydromethanopterin reductase-like flavin-dependent oxidoreductase (luciferase family)
MITTVFGLVPDEETAKRVVHAVLDAGVPPRCLSVMAATQRETDRLAADVHAHSGHGSMMGANLGGALGWLAGAATLAIPGLGLFVLAGPILGMVSGAALGAAIGNLRGGMVEIGMPDQVVDRYQEAVRNGHVLVAVHVEGPELEQRMMTLLREHGAVDIDSSATESDHQSVAPDGTLHSHPPVP